MNIDIFLKIKGYTVHRLSKETGISKQPCLIYFLVKVIY